MIYRMLADGTLRKIPQAVADAENLQYSLYGDGIVGGPLRWLGLGDKWDHIKRTRKIVAEAQRRATNAS